jgi:hypothetical protein
MFGGRCWREPKKGDATTEWRILNDEKFNEFYSPYMVVRMMKLKRMRWPRHAPRIMGIVDS